MIKIACLCLTIALLSLGTGNAACMGAVNIYRGEIGVGAPGNLNSSESANDYSPSEILGRVLYHGSGLYWNVWGLTQPRSRFIVDGTSIQSPNVWASLIGIVNPEQTRFDIYVATPWGGGGTDVTGTVSIVPFNTYQGIPVAPNFYTSVSINPGSRIQTGGMWNVGASTPGAYGIADPVSFGASIAQLAVPTPPPNGGLSVPSNIQKPGASVSVAWQIW